MLLLLEVPCTLNFADNSSILPPSISVDTTLKEVQESDLAPIDDSISTSSEEEDCCICGCSCCWCSSLANLFATYLWEKKIFYRIFQNLKNSTDQNKPDCCYPVFPFLFSFHMKCPFNYCCPLQASDDKCIGLRSIHWHYLAPTYCEIIQRLCRCSHLLIRSCLESN